MNRNLNEDERREMREVAKPLMKFLNERCHPHCLIVVTPDSYKLLETVVKDNNDEFVKD